MSANSAARHHFVELWNSDCYDGPMLIQALHEQRMKNKAILSAARDASDTLRQHGYIGESMQLDRAIVEATQKE